MEENNILASIIHSQLFSEDSIKFIKKCYIHLNQARHGVWAFADLSEIVWHQKVHKKNKELYFSIVHDAIAYEIITYEEILEMVELKTDFLNFYSSFVSKINTSHEYTNFLEDRINTLENRFGLVWKEQEEQLLKIVSEKEIVLGVGRFLINEEYEFISESKDKKKKIIKDKQGKDFTLTRKRGDSFIYFCKDLDQLFLLYSVQSKVNIYSFVENHYTKYYPILVKKGEKFGFGEVRDNLLIEGDNYYALQLLQFTHKGKIDVIYIDPPYNTGNGDFKYNDAYVGSDDASRHSKWLSFMDKRLKLAINLLTDDGIIFLSIDQNESSNLELLTSKVFGKENLIQQIYIKSNPRGKQQEIIPSCGDYLFVYCKNKNKLTALNGLHLNKEELKEYNKKDINGKIYRELGLRKRGADSKKEDAPSMFFPIFVNEQDGTVSNKITELHTSEVIPKLESGELGRWRWGFNTVSTNNPFLFAKKVKTKGTKNYRLDIFEKNYLEVEGKIKKRKATSLWEDNFVNNENGTKELKKIFHSNKNMFDFPKSVELIKNILNLIIRKDIIILDFFSGSGTTAQATIQLNKEDSGNRKFILCTNNESNICEEITYQRMKRLNSPKEYNLDIEQLSHGLEYLQIKHISDLDLENADDIGNFEYVKHINNVKFNSTRVILENDFTYFTDKYSVFKKKNKNKKKEYIDFFDLSIKNSITNIVFVSSDTIEYDYFRKIISDHILNLPANSIFEKITYYQMSKNYMDNMLSIVSGENEVDVESHKSVDLESGGEQ